MAFCRKCGQEMAEADLFCPKCGARQEEAVAAEPVAENAVEQKPAESSVGMVIVRKMAKFLFWVIAVIVFLCVKHGCKEVGNFFTNLTRDFKNMSLEDLEEYTKDEVLEIAESDAKIDVRGMEVEDVELAHVAGDLYTGTLAVRHASGEVVRYKIDLEYDRKMPQVTFDTTDLYYKTMTVERLEQHVAESIHEAFKGADIDMYQLKVEDVDLHHVQGDEYKGFMSIRHQDGSVDRYDLKLELKRDEHKVIYDLGVFGEMRLRAKTQDWW